MAKIKIISSVDDLFPVQQVKLVRDTLNIKTDEGDERIYPIRDSIVSLDIVSQHWGNTVFDLKLCDGAQFRGEARKGIAHRLIKFTGASPHKVEERTAQQVRRKRNLKRAGIVFLILALVAIGGGNNNTAQDHHIQGANIFGCTEEGVYDKAFDLLGQGDRVAFAKYLAAAKALRVCTVFQNGERVFVSSPGILKTKIHRPGQTTEYWTTGEFVR